MGKKKDQPLTMHLAAEQGLIDEIKAMLENGEDVNQLDEDAQTPIQVASKAGDMAIFKLLLEAGAKVDVPDAKGRTALTEASKRGHLEVVKILLAHGADPIRADVKDATPFHMASKKGHHEVAQLLIDAGADVLLSKANYKGYTPLHEAARKGKEELAMRYVELGADVNAPDNHGNRAAILAHAFGYPELAEKLGALTEEELAESQKIQNIEDVKESAKQIAVDKAEAENRPVSKLETKSVAKAALDYYLENLDTERPYEELKAEAHKAAAECLENLSMAEKA